MSHKYEYQLKKLLVVVLCTLLLECIIGQKKRVSYSKNNMLVKTDCDYV